MNITVQNILSIAGLAQVVLALSSLAIPQVLKWRSELSKVKPLIKQMAWVHAAYIFVINLCLGLISMFDGNELINGSRLAKILVGFIAVYWLSRVLIQFFYFNRADFPKGRLNQLAEIVLTILFICLSLVYSCITYINLVHA